MRLCISDCGYIRILLLKGVKVCVIVLIKLIILLWDTSWRTTIFGSFQNFSQHIWKFSATHTLLITAENLLHNKGALIIKIQLLKFFHHFFFVTTLARIFPFICYSTVFINIAWTKQSTFTYIIQTKENAIYHSKFLLIFPINHVHLHHHVDEYRSIFRNLRFI